MKILSMTATFGRLEGATLELGGGLNLIEAPNEGGKSTWCAFWKAMLYGIDTRDRDKKGRLADKNHYQPWSGSPMMGELNLEWQGKAITIRRGPRGNTPFGAFSAVYTGTNTPVPSLTAQNCGEMLTGVSREVFERSAFLGGSDLTVTPSPELEQRIAALVSSGQEEVSYSQVEGKLREWSNRRRVNRSVGLIPKLEEELGQVNSQLEQLDELAARNTQLESDYIRLTRARGACAAEAAVHKKLSRRDLNLRYAQADRDYQEALGRLRQLEQDSARLGDLPEKDKLKRAQGELQYLKVLEEEIQAGKAAADQAEESYVEAQRLVVSDPRFPGMAPEEAELKIHQDLNRRDDLLKKAKSARVRAWVLFLLGLGAGGVLLALALTEILPIHPGFGAVSAVLGAALAVWSMSQSKSRNNQAAKVLDRWSVQSEEELDEVLEDYRARYEDAREAADRLKQLRTTLSEKETRRTVDQADLTKFIHSFAPEVKSAFGFSAALSRALGIDHELAAARERAELCARRREDLAAQGAHLGEDDGAPMPAPIHTQAQCAQMLAQLDEQLARTRGDLDRAKGALSSLGDPAALSARREELEGELTRRQGELSALSLAQDALSLASTQLQARFSPALNNLAGKFLARLTGEKYVSLTLDKDMEGQAARQGDVLPHSALYLSRGTLDQLYLAVRLAVCCLCLPEKPPILLDDALTAFDDQRMVLALELLRELGMEQQVLLFTCQSREGKALAGASEVSRVKLG